MNATDKTLSVADAVWQMKADAASFADDAASVFARAASIVDEEDFESLRTDGAVKQAVRELYEEDALTNPEIAEAVAFQFAALYLEPDSTIGFGWPAVARWDIGKSRDEASELLSRLVAIADELSGSH